MIRRLLRAVFHTGRHHVHTARRDDNGALVTVSTIAARIRREAALAWAKTVDGRPYRYGGMSIAVVPDVERFSPRLENLLALYAEGCARALPEQLGAMSV
ncbi:hypothetical protein [Mycolicibacterium komossense]|uniref:Uncharacterized protein n=1 Tax=Mycolicibacterium komossense TaxID=1779 RepID=A0ABT3C9G6_9MYCO|nr:hypothetical protein [Mycolicibacterium komossense]MCV7226097.1 hypothetical protein [Mycolicibacterium komossense]